MVEIVQKVQDLCIMKRNLALCLHRHVLDILLQAGIMKGLKLKQKLLMKLEIIIQQFTLRGRQTRIL